MDFLRLLPNSISLLRLLAVPLTVYLLMSQEMVAAFWVIVAAGVSDGLDGYLAKRFNAVTRLGTYLDPLADKAMLIAVCLCLVYLGYLPGWIVALAILRDLLIGWERWHRAAARRLQEQRANDNDPAESVLDCRIRGLYLCRPFVRIYSLAVSRWIGGRLFS